MNHLDDIENVVTSCPCCSGTTRKWIWTVEWIRFKCWHCGHEVVVRIK